MKLFVTLLFCSLSVYGQNPDIFTSFGYHAGYSKMPAFTNETTNTAEQFVGIDLGINIRIRYNVLEMNDNSSLSVEAMPSLGMETGIFRGSDDAGYLGFRIPLMFAYNLGAASTYQSESDLGVGLGIGLSAKFLPTIIPEKGDNKYKSVYFNPCVQLSVRMWNDEEFKIREFFLRYSFMKNGNGFDQGWISDPLSIVGGYVKYFGT